MCGNGKTWPVTRTTEVHRTLRSCVEKTPGKTYSFPSRSYKNTTIPGGTSLETEKRDSDTASIASSGDGASQAMLGHRTIMSRGRTTAETLQWTVKTKIYTTYICQAAAVKIFGLLWIQ